MLGVSEHVTAKMPTDFAANAPYSSRAVWGAVAVAVAWLWLWLCLCVLCVMCVHCVGVSARAR